MEIHSSDFAIGCTRTLPLSLLMTSQLYTEQKGLKRVANLV